MILLLYFKIYFFNDSLFIDFLKICIFQNKLKIVQTLLKWLFWTGINLVIIKKQYCSWSICNNTVCGTSYIYTIFKQNKQLELFIFTQNLSLY